MELKLSKKIVKVVLVLTMALGLFVANTSKASAWRDVKTRSINRYTLAARADLPYNADSSGGGNWKAQATYSGTKKNNKLTVGWEFYSIGGSVSYQGMGVSGSGSNTGSSFTATGSTANASGRVYGHGFCFYVGMYSTASFSNGSNYYSTTAKI